MTSRRPRIEGFAIISREGMIAASDGSFPETLKIPADQKFYQDSIDRAATGSTHPVPVVGMITSALRS